MFVRHLTGSGTINAAQLRNVLIAFNDAEAKLSIRLADPIPCRCRDLTCALFSRLAKIFVGTEASMSS